MELRKDSKDRIKIWIVATTGARSYIGKKHKNNKKKKNKKKKKKKKKGFSTMTGIE